MFKRGSAYNQIIGVPTFENVLVVMEEDLVLEHIHDAMFEYELVVGSLADTTSIPHPTIIVLPQRVKHRIICQTSALIPAKGAHVEGNESIIH